MFASYSLRRPRPPRGWRGCTRADSGELGLARGESQGTHWVDAELHRVHPQTLLDRGDATEDAEARFARSLEIAREQETKFFELRTAMGLARLPQRQGRRDEARALLAPCVPYPSTRNDSVWSFVKRAISPA
jgi:predicted ATPase